MEKDGNYSAEASSSSMAPEARAYPHDVHGYHDQDHVQQFLKARAPQFEVPQHENHGGSSSSSLMVDYMLNNNNSFSHPLQQQEQTGLLGFSDVMQFTGDFVPKHGLNHSKLSSDEETGIDPVFFVKFPVLNDKHEGNEHMLAIGQSHEVDHGLQNEEASTRPDQNVGFGKVGAEEEILPTTIAAVETSQAAGAAASGKNKRKRGRAVKTSEEVESQRMTHIAVERNRRKQMNEHLRVLRSLMPGSYVQRGDQASIIGGSIEFIRELEQLLQCLESQKRRRLYGDNPTSGNNNPATRPVMAGDTMTNTGFIQQQPMIFQSPNFLPNSVAVDNQTSFDAPLDQEEETAENKSSLADVEVKILGFDAMIKILSRRRHGQLIRTITALEDLQLVILHTNITTIEQTVLYSFTVKVSSEARYSANDLADSVQRIFSFIYANTN